MDPARHGWETSPLSVYGPLGSSDHVQVVHADLALTTNLVGAALTLEKSLNFTSVFMGSEGFESKRVRVFGQRCMWC
jgi:hypothetical protein